MRDEYAWYADAVLNPLSVFLKSDQDDGSLFDLFMDLDKEIKEREEGRRFGSLVQGTPQNMSTYFSRCRRHLPGAV